MIKDYIKTYPDLYLDDLSEYKIHVAIFDVDGVFTDGSISYSNNGFETKTFNVLDGIGVQILNHSGIDVKIVTGRQSEVVSRRFNELGVHEVFQGVVDKRSLVNDIINNSKYEAAHFSYMGDDFPDLAVFDLVGLSCAPQNAHWLVKQNAIITTANCGGFGAVREFVDRILIASGKCPYQEYLNMIGDKYK